MNTHDTYARIANILGGIPANHEGSVKAVIDEHAAHHAKAGASTAAPISTPLTDAELAAIRDNLKVGTARVKAKKR